MIPLLEADVVLHHESSFSHLPNFPYKATGPLTLCPYCFSRSSIFISSKLKLLFSGSRSSWLRRYAPADKLGTPARISDLFPDSDHSSQAVGNEERRSAFHRSWTYEIRPRKSKRLFVSESAHASSYLFHHQREKPRDFRVHTYSTSLSRSVSTDQLSFFSETNIRHSIISTSTFSRAV